MFTKEEKSSKRSKKTATYTLSFISCKTHVTAFERVIAPFLSKFIPIVRNDIVLWQTNLSYLRKGDCLIYKILSYQSIMYHSFGWPQFLPPCNFFPAMQLPDSSIKTIYFIAFFYMMLPIYHGLSPSGSSSVLCELQNHHICQQRHFLIGWTAKTLFSK